jgi:hypothetical protein
VRDFYIGPAMLLPLALLAALGSESGPATGWSRQLETIHRGMHGHALGYMDLGQIQDLDPDAPIGHPTAGDLDGFVQIRRATGILLGPDSSAPVRLGLEASWQSGGWTPDLYWLHPADPSLTRRSWSFGVGGGWTETDLFAVAGVHHSDAADWSGNGGGRAYAPETDLWADLRWRRWGGVGSIDRHGPTYARGGLLTDSRPLKQHGPWLWELLSAEVWWERDDWNGWSHQDAWGGDLLVPLLRDRVSVRSQVGSDGFRFGQVTSDVDPQGQVGLDGTVSRWKRDWRPGVRLRIPLLTFSVNDPDDVTEFGMRGNLVWSLRFRMVWEDGQTWYAPGRRPAPTHSRMSE